MSWRPINEDFCDGVVGVPARLVGVSQLRLRILGIPMPSAHPDDWALLPTCTHWAVYSRADSGSFPGVIERSLASSDLREPCDTSRLTAGSCRRGPEVNRGQVQPPWEGRFGELLSEDNMTLSRGWIARLTGQSQRNADWTGEIGQRARCIGKAGNGNRSSGAVGVGGLCCGAERRHAHPHWFAERHHQASVAVHHWQERRPDHRHLCGRHATST